MSYSIYRQTVSSLPLIVLQNNASGERVEILPTLGGAIHRLALNAGKGVEQLLFCDADHEIEKNPKTRSRILFPWNDRLPGARFSFEGKTVQMTPDKGDGSKIHGLIRQAEMQELGSYSCENYAAVLLGISLARPEQYDGWPYPLRLEIDYRLEPQRLRIEFRVINEGQVKAPFALGWHPYFTLGGKISETLLTLSGERVVEVGADLMPTGNLPAVKGTPLDFSKAKPIGKDELDIAIEAGDGVARLEREGKVIEIHQDSEFFEWFQLYTPEDGLSIAIEPVSGATDALNRPELGLAVLEPGEELLTWCEVRAGSAR